ncbi:hypothetical protein [Maricaulis sp.]|uniref:hypothetical protein n=1 Tax=Maricaulis sp. TaxID=1486257 RepID=UPI0032978AEF
MRRLGSIAGLLAGFVLLPLAPHAEVMPMADGRPKSPPGFDRAGCSPVMQAAILAFQPDCARRMARLA